MLRQKVYTATVFMATFASSAKVSIEPCSSGMPGSINRFVARCFLPYHGKPVHSQRRFEDDDGGQSKQTRYIGEVN